MAKLDQTLGGGDVALLGCGKMGGALLTGWLAAGVRGSAIHIAEPAPAPTVLETAERVGATLGLEALDRPDVVVIAVKPQTMAEALPAVARFAGAGALFVSIAAGATIADLKRALGPAAPVVRAMPNTPAAVGRGATALFASDEVSDRGRALSEALMAAVGDTVWLESEAQMDAVTALSGSGPAYVFHLIEALTAAGVAEGLAPDLAARLARATVSGAGALAAESADSAEQLRINVTSPGGTTAAGLVELMAPERGLSDLMRRTVAAAARRSRELAG